MKYHIELVRGAKKVCCECELFPGQIKVVAGDVDLLPLRFHRITGKTIPKYAGGWQLAPGELQRINAESGDTPVARGYGQHSHKNPFNVHNLLQKKISLAVVHLLLNTAAANPDASAAGVWRLAGKPCSQAAAHHYLRQAGFVKTRKSKVPDEIRRHVLQLARMYPHTPIDELWEKHGRPCGLNLFRRIMSMAA